MAKGLVSAAKYPCRVLGRQVGVIVKRSGTDAETPRSEQVNAKGDTGWNTTYFGVKSALDPSAAAPAVGAFHPTAYFIEVGAGFISYPHFHVADQFQVFVGGGGSLGKHKLDGVTVHYTSAYSPYGPICAGPEGASWFTLRNMWDSKLHYMPESRDELRASGRRPRAAAEPALTPLDAGALAQTATTASHALFAYADGLRAIQHRVRPGAMLTGDTPSSGGGQYWLVLGGEAHVGGAVVPRFGFVFVEPDDRAISMTAGARGLDVLALQFSRLPL